ncbi:MAG: Ribosomal protein S7 [Candidatus Methanohalarchaeum thermophilum]|uniref:Small ribosomal subunit protein uS7 n=1 Tax=Methanohalarchaeum thermophilum TaxID=1903181 RepID=A0A1Q6DS35_METT1|nr:MAG: Ribosomal protein S7 [Candidatus Methanohalarchaeum thermophilum]
MTKLFGKYDLTEVEVTDKGLERYINLDPVVVPHSGGRKADNKFKSEVPVVEQLMNKLMRGEENTGKKNRAFNIVKDAFDRINQQTDENPVQLLVYAIQNSGPREGTVRLKQGGISIQKPVDISPQRRVNTALMLIAKGAKKESFKNKKDIEDCLAEEIIKAADFDMSSYAVSKKEEKERVAKAAR